MAFVAFARLGLIPPKARGAYIKSVELQHSNWYGNLACREREGEGQKTNTSCMVLAITLGNGNHTALSKGIVLIFTCGCKILLILTLVRLLYSYTRAY
jgi:hypothetical protein